ncbi:MAG: molecular chaperone [Sphingomonadaceae bacterium]
MRCSLFSPVRLLCAVAVFSVASPALAVGDLLIAPTRLILNGSRGTELILNNIGSETATYRISLEVRRMTADGSIEEVDPATANAQEKLALSMISYAPRRIVLPPNQPQSIRVAIRAPQGLADGEYRAHMLFRAIPDAKPVADTAAPSEGISISLTPIYGITIPIIIRQGNLAASAAITGVKIDRTQKEPALVVGLSRAGSRSVYGNIVVRKAGVTKPLFEARGLAVYPEVNSREVRLGLTPEAAAAMSGAVAVEYREDASVGGGLIAEYKTVIR